MFSFNKEGDLLTETCELVAKVFVWILKSLVTGIFNNPA